MKTIFKSKIFWTVLIVLGLGIGYISARRFTAKADPKIILIKNLDDYKAYEALDRDQALLLSESGKLKQQYDQDAVRKLEIRKQLGVPDDYVEKRDDDKNIGSPVIGFVAPPATPGAK